MTFEEFHSGVLSAEANLKQAEQRARTFLNITQTIDFLRSFPWITVTGLEEDKYGVERIIEFVAGDEIFRVEWWSNLCFLWHGPLRIAYFTMMDYGDLCFYYRGEEVARILRPAEEGGE